MAIADYLNKYTKVRERVVDISYCDDHVLFNGNEVWTYCITDGIPMGVPRMEEIADHINKTNIALENHRGKECHLYLATRAFDTERWVQHIFENQAKERAATGITPAPAFERIIIEQAQRMHNRGYKQFSRYLGVKLGTRKHIADKALGAGESRLKTAFSSSARSIAKKAKALDPVPSAAEVKYWTDKAIEVRTRLTHASQLNARAASAQDMWEWVWHMLTLGMNVPPPNKRPMTQWGAMELMRYGTYLDNRAPNILKLSAENPHLLSEYRLYEQLKADYEASPDKEMLNLPIKPDPEINSAFVSLSVKVPELVGTPWLFQTTTSEESVDASIRFTIHSKKDSKKEAQGAVIALEKEINHQKESGIQGGTDETANRYQRAKEHSRQFNTGGGRTQMDFTCRFLVHAKTEERARLDAQSLIAKFEEMVDTKLEWVRDGQGAFYFEAFPGAMVKNPLHKEKGDLNILTNGLPFATRHIGHSMDGFYLGAYGQIPMLYDPARVAKQGKATTMIFNGSLGGGKTSAMMQYLDTFRLRGYTCLVIDPKIDFNSHFALPGRGHARLWDLTKDGKSGMLDPFTLIDRAVDPEDPERDTPEKARAKWKESTLELVVDTITRTLDKDLTSIQSTILQELVRTEMDSKNPSMESLMNRFKYGEVGAIFSDVNMDENAEQKTHYALQSRSIYSHLQTAATSERGRLIYGARKGDLQIMLKNVPTTIINVSGLDLPQNGEPAQGSSQIISVTIFSLICAYAVRLLKNRHLRGTKCLVVDEVNVIKGLPAFKSMAANINSVARSLSIVPMYGDQSSASSTDATLFSNKIGSRIVFKSSLAEREAIATDMGWKNADAAELIRTMPHETAPSGRALHTTQPDKGSLYPNYQGIGVVDFDRDWNPEYTDAFETNDEQLAGFVRAAYRPYPFDEWGVLHDPLSEELTTIEVEDTEIEETLYVPEPVEPKISEMTHDDNESFLPAPPPEREPEPAIGGFFF